MRPTQDIIDELRKESAHGPCPRRVSDMLTEAADRLDHLFASGIHTCHADCQRPMCVLRRERDKALAELERVTAERDRWVHDYSEKYDETRDPRTRVAELERQLKSEIEARNGWWDNCKQAEQRVAELEEKAERYRLTTLELDRVALERDNAKTCAAIHFGAVRWLERYVKVLKIELHRQELANLRKKRTIRGLRNERTKMRKLVKEACDEQLAKINAARVERMEDATHLYGTVEEILSGDAAPVSMLEKDQPKRRQFRLILVGHRTAYGVPVHSGNRLEEWRSDLGGGIWLYVDAFPSREDAESYVKSCGGVLEILP